METVVYLIRHSESTSKNNLKMISNSDSNQVQNEKSFLSVSGEKKAEELSKHPELQNIDAVYCSNYVRALETAKYIALENNTIINVDDRFYYTVPSRWLGKIAVLKDTNSRIREIYLYNPDDMLVGESLIYFRAVSKSEWDKGEYESEGCEEIMNDGQTAYICRISSAARNEGITLDNVKSNFKLFEQEWYKWSEFL